MRIRLVSLAALFSMVLAAGAGTAASPTAPTVNRINYATSFGQFGRDAYVYAAIEKGYFAKENESLPVRTISVVHQNTMSAILTLAESGVRTPRDLVGKTLADSPASTVRILFPLYARKAKIETGSVRWRDAAPPALPGLLTSKQVDGVGQFVVGRPLFATTAGKPVSALRYSDYLKGFLGIGIMASENTIRNRRDLTRRFVRALNKGLRYAISNPRATAAILKKHQPLVNEAVAAQELKIMKFFVATKGTRKFGVGYIDAQKMKSTRSVIASGGFQLANPIAYRDLYAPGFVKVGTFTEKRRR